MDIKWIGGILIACGLGLIWLFGYDNALTIIVILAVLAALFFGYKKIQPLLGKTPYDF